jgi:hypothetical protein
VRWMGESRGMGWDGIDDGVGGGERCCLSRCCDFDVPGGKSMECWCLGCWRRIGCFHEWVLDVVVLLITILGFLSRR